MKKQQKIQAHTAIILANVIFGLGVPVTKLLLDQWVTPMGYMFMRCLGDSPCSHGIRKKDILR